MNEPTLGHNETAVRLAALAGDAQIALDKVSRGETDAIDGWLAYGAALNEGRALFAGDREFGQWVTEVCSANLAVHDHERAAAMWAAANREQFEEARAAGNARTVRGIHAKWKEIEAERQAPAGADYDDDDDDDDDIVSSAWDRVNYTTPTEADPDPAPVATTREALMREIEAERDARAAAKREARDEKERALAARIREGAKALEAAKEYGVILADPPWRFEPYSRETGMDRAADNHYPTSGTDEICALRAPAAADAVLFLWATAPMLPDALRVMEAWGFAYKSHVVWAKDRIGTGYWARNKHELLLIGTRGNIPAPSPGTQPASLIEAAVSRHSAKPEVFHEMIERLFPTIPRIEMFARSARPGWDVWGAEAPEQENAA